MANPKDRAAAVARKLVRVELGSQLYVAGCFIRDCVLPATAKLYRSDYIITVAAALRKAGIR